MGLLTRTFVPRSVRRATHPVRTVKRAATPRVVKQAQRSLHPVSNAVYSAQRPLNTKPRKRKTGKAQPVQQSAPEYVPSAKRGWTIAASLALVWFGGLTLIWGWRGMVATTVVALIIAGVAASKRMGI